MGIAAQTAAAASKPTGHAVWRRTMLGRGLAIVPPLVGVALALAPTVIAAPSDVLAQAVASSRAAPCGPLQRDPVVDHAAEIINQSTYAYLNHTAENVPADDGHPTTITKDVGIQGEKVTALHGAAHDTTSAIKAAILQGYSALPDCSYSRFGTSILYEGESAYVLAVVVLVGA